jgi:aldose 1-epimerase
VLNHETFDAYRQKTNRFFGCVVGRYCNRIALGSFVLPGSDQAFALDKNNNGNSLHGGGGGFHSRVWQSQTINERTVRFTYLSQDMEEGYPGEVNVSVVYEVALDANALLITYASTTTKLTHVNLTNHSYFNLTGQAGGGKLITDHLLTLNAKHYTPVDAKLIPTGEILKVDGTALDFTTPTKIGVT